MGRDSEHNTVTQLERKRKKERRKGGGEREGVMVSGDFISYWSPIYIPSISNYLICLVLNTDQ